MRATDIIWDTDGEDIELPVEIDIPDTITNEEDISDYLSDTIGFCHKGFKLRLDENLSEAFIENTLDELGTWHDELDSDDDTENAFILKKAIAIINNLQSRLSEY